MLVLLLHANRLRAPQPAPPLGLCLVASALEAAGHQVRLLDLCFSRRPGEDLARELRTHPPEAIGLSLRNLDNGESLRPRFYLPEAQALAALCRRGSSAPLILGGSAVNVAPAEVMRRTGADYAVVGDGEEALPALLARLAAGRPVAGLPGVYAAGAPVPPAPARVADLSALPDPRPGEWLDLRRYLRHGAALPVQSKRGCAFECTYCTYPLLEGREYRTRSPEAVADEVARAARDWGVRRFEFVDATFNHPYDHARAVCEALARGPGRPVLHTMGLNPSGATPELLGAMRRAGFRSAICAAESGSDRMLESLCKGFHVKQVAQAAAAARGAGVSTLWSFMFGGPGEDEGTVRETLRFIETGLGPHDRAICTLGLRVYPGTRLAETAREEGALAPDADLSEPVFYFSPRISPTRTLELIEASPARPRMVYLETVQRASVALGARLWTALHLPGAAWSALPLYNRVARAWRFGRPPRYHDPR